MSELIIKDSGVLARAELDTQISTAKAYPRDAKRAVEYATTLATMDEATAQSCFYCLPRKEQDGTKKEIRGGSIRLAEIMAAAWGNIHAATRIVENDGKHITAEGVAWDLESNVKIAMQNKVSIRFGGKNGKPEYTASSDMQTVLSNAASAKALRNAIFKVIPKALVDRVQEQAMNFAVGDQKTINAKVADIFDKLVKMGLDKQAILDYYGRKSLSEITTDDFKSLIGVGTAIKEGHIKIEEVFAIEKGDSSVSAADHINKILAEKKNISAATKSEDSAIANSEVPTEGVSLYEKVKKQLNSAKSLDTLQLAADLIREVEPEKQEELTKIYKEKEQKLY